MKYGAGACLRGVFTVIPSHSFMAADVAASLLAVCLFSLFTLIPGYAVAWALDLFDFRSRTLAFRAALSIALSIALLPSIGFFVGRFGSMPMVWAILAVWWLGFVWSLVRDPLRRIPPSQNWRFPVLAALVWLAIAIGALVDLQIGSRLYYSVPALDFSTRSEVIQAITVQGVPPHNPFFTQSHPALLRYHYFWMLICSLAQSAGLGLVSARQAWIGGTFWAGLGLISIVGLYLRYFLPSRERFGRQFKFAILLLGVTGLDLVPTVILKLVAGRLLPSVEWWNEQVDWFGWTAVWGAHYLAGLIAALTGFLLVSEAVKTAGRARWKYALLAGIAFAASAGASIFVAFAFAAFLAAWFVLALLRRWRAELQVLTAAGATAVVFVLPYLATLTGAGQGSGGLPLGFTVRRFNLLDEVLVASGMSSWRIHLANLVALPANYFLELGFFLGASLLWWEIRRKRKEKLSRGELALLTMTLASVAVCTFLRSTVIDSPDFNDLGWRGFLVAQFGLLLWSADVLSQANRKLGRALPIMLVLGVSGTVYDLAVARFYPLLADRGVLPELLWMSKDRNLGARNYLVREAYEWIGAHTPADASVQFDPHVVYQDTGAFLYAARPFLAPNPSCLAGFGGDPAVCRGLMRKIALVFPGNSGLAAPSLSSACSGLPARILVAKDGDSVWNDRASWVWSDRPVFSNADVRVFDCSLAKPPALPVLSGETKPISTLAPK